MTGQEHADADAQARDAVAVLCADAFVVTRALARAVARHGADRTARVHGQVSALDWIRQLADLCHNLPRSLSPGTRTTPLTALGEVWAAADPEQRAWISAVLEPKGLSAALFGLSPD